MTFIVGEFLHDSVMSSPKKRALVDDINSLGILPSPTPISKIREAVEHCFNNTSKKGSSWK
jgi:hypothetical protein